MPRRFRRRMLLLYAATIFLSAALLFLVQPMIAKLLLPMLGGSPAVWNTSMVFFQAALLGGYLYAHLLSKLKALKAQVLIHAGVLLLPLLLLPVEDPREWLGPQGESPLLWLLGALAVAVGGPFFVLSTTGPLLQRWFAKGSRDPYFLYAASNAGSMLSLLAYPVVLEPTLTLARQREVFTIGYVAFATLLLACGGLVLRTASHALSRAERREQQRKGIPVAAEPPGFPPPISWKTRALWLALAFVPSSLMLGVTQHLSTDVAAVPLLWVIPLAIYLFTFVLAFSGRPGLGPEAASTVLVWLGVALAVVFLFHPLQPIWALIGLHLMTLFVAAMLCHGRLAVTRPDPRRLTEFYLVMALGGVLGGLFNSVLAPLVFDAVAEYPIAVAVAVLLTVRPNRFSGWRWVLDLAGPAAVVGAFYGAKWALDRIGIVGGPLHPVLWFSPALLLCVLLVRRRAGFALSILTVMLISLGRPADNLELLHKERTFFGVHRVERDRSGDWTRLMHGTTRHGLQATNPPLRYVPTSYYFPTGPLGNVMDAMRGHERFVSMAVVGLGAGGIAAHGRAGQTVTFYEIDPAVERIARDRALFTYLADARAEVRVVIGDARLRLADASDGAYDLIVLDAFSSDAIPVHLVTLEAVRMYLDKLAPDGLLAFHVSNRYLELRAVLVGIAGRLGLVALERDEPSDQIDPAETRVGKVGSTWMVLVRRMEDAGALAADERWREGTANARTPVWTDDYSNILTVFRWR